MIAIVRQKDLKRLSKVEAVNLRDAKQLAQLWSVTAKQSFFVVDIIGFAEDGTWTVPK